MRILWFNWRDLKNPAAGGAEVFTHEVMRRLSKKGHQLTLFTSKFQGAPSQEKIDGIEIFRDGSKYRVYNKAKSFYEKHKNDYDLVVDEINTRPFLTPKFIKNRPIIALIHQLAREFWFYETRFPLNYIGYYYLERKWLSYYKNIPTITVSNSSRMDLEEMGFAKILMLSEGLNITPLSKLPKKETEPTVVFIGRLKKVKLPHHAVEAFSIIKKHIPNAKMWVIGDGYMRPRLEHLHIKDITYFGSIDQERKYQLLSLAHLVLVPAVREGWGLVVTESNAMGTPAVGYNVPGLRDSIRDGETGILTKENTPAELADAALSLLKNENLLNKLSAHALAFSKQFNWDNTADEFDKILASFYK
ncbi:MAG: glycosyltransferase family 4 protein [Thermoproteota archaeon]